MADRHGDALSNAAKIGPKRIERRFRRLSRKLGSAWLRRQAAPARAFRSIANLIAFAVDPAMAMVLMTHAGAQRPEMSAEQAADRFDVRRCERAGGSRRDRGLGCR